MQMSFYKRQNTSNVFVLIVVYRSIPANVVVQTIREKKKSYVVEVDIIANQQEKTAVMGRRIGSRRKASVRVQKVIASKLMIMNFIEEHGALTVSKSYSFYKINGKNSYLVTNIVFSYLLFLANGGKQQPRDSTRTISQASNGDGYEYSDEFTVVDILNIGDSVLLRKVWIKYSLALNPVMATFIMVRVYIFRHIRARSNTLFFYLGKCTVLHAVISIFLIVFLIIDIRYCEELSNSKCVVNLIQVRHDLSLFFSNSWCEWQEDNLDVDETRVVCLLCDESDETAEGLMCHMREKHEFDFLKLIDDNNLGVYQRMKLVNYIRKQNYNALCWVCQRNDLGNTIGLAKHMQEEEKPIKTLPDSSLWNIEEYLVPIFGNDHFLWMFESYLENRNFGSNELHSDNRGHEKSHEAFVSESKRNTVEGVIAEDLPDLHELSFSDLEELM
uniref:Zf-C2H2_2 domain-containing protein n=1 Tax=Heterorhabditis bacteriophora TaxID=37862 RepID=A0A1I7X1P9_HETBA